MPLKNALFFQRLIPLIVLTVFVGLKNRPTNQQRCLQSSARQTLSVHGGVSLYKCGNYSKNMCSVFPTTADKL